MLGSLLRQQQHGKRLSRVSPVQLFIERLGHLIELARSGESRGGRHVLCVGRVCVWCREVCWRCVVQRGKWYSWLCGRAWRRQRQTRAAVGGSNESVSDKTHNPGFCEGKGRPSPQHLHTLNPQPPVPLTTQNKMDKSLDDLIAEQRKKSSKPKPTASKPAPRERGGSGGGAGSRAADRDSRRDSSSRKNSSRQKDGPREAGGGYFLVSV